MQENFFDTHKMTIKKIINNDRLRAFSLIGTTFSSGAAFGPFIAGLLSDYLGWRTVFWLPTSLSLLSLLLVLKYAKESAVHKSQAGMATRIFNAIRLSGDGIALVTVSELLSEYLYSNIHAVENNLPSSQIKALTNQLSTSSFSNLNRYFPYISKDEIIFVYDSAFHATIFTLGLITLFISLVVFMLLRAKN